MEGSDSKSEIAETTQVLTRHLLEKSWTMWTLSTQNSKTEAQNTAIGTFSTVEEFWAIYNSMKKPSEMITSSNTKVNVIIVREGEKPEWEENPAGGEWLMLGGKSWRDEKVIDDIWEDLLLKTVGGTLAAAEEVLCIWLQIRGKYDKISIWTDNAKDKEKVMAIGNDMMQSVKAGVARPSLNYTAHEAQIKATIDKAKGTYVEVKPTYTIDGDKNFVAPSNKKSK